MSIFIILKFELIVIGVCLPHCRVEGTGMGLAAAMWREVQAGGTGSVQGPERFVL